MEIEKVLVPRVKMLLTFEEALLLRDCVNNSIAILKERLPNNQQECRASLYNVLDRFVREADITYVEDS